MKQKLTSMLLALLLILTLLPAQAFAANSQNVDLTVTIRDFKADGVLFEGDIVAAEGLVQNRLGADNKPVYNLSLWQECFGESITQGNLNAFFNDVPGVNMKTTKTLTLRPCSDAEYAGYWEIDSSIDQNGDYLDGYFPIDNELFGNQFTYDGETYDEGHNYHFSVEIHSKFKYVQGGTFEFSGDDDVWVFFNKQLVIDLGGVHGESYADITLDEIASQLGIKVGDIVDFDMFYMERHTTGSNMRILTNFDFLNLQASSWAQAELAQASSLGLIPDCLVGADLTKPITRAEFAAVSVKVFEALTFTKATPVAVNPFTDTSDAEVLKAYNVGVTNGISADKFAPTQLLNREQAATMLTRVFKKVNFSGWTLATDGNFKLEYTKATTFADDADISSWAKDSVYFMNSHGIIKGMGENQFRPKNTTPAQEAAGYAQATREQALLIATRMVNTLK